MKEKRYSIDRDTFEVMKKILIQMWLEGNNNKIGTDSYSHITHMMTYGTCSEYNWNRLQEIIEQYQNRI